MFREIPTEFAREAAEAEIDIELVDKRGEEYKETPKVMQAFSGTGQKLGR